MTSNKDRREIARKLRSEAELWRKSYPGTEIDLSETEVVFQDVAHFLGIHGKTCPEMLYNRLAELIDRPKCRKIIPSEMDGCVFCSNCGAEIGEYGVPNYCHNCGVEVA